MENTEIRCLNQLEASHVQQTAALLGDKQIGKQAGLGSQYQIDQTYTLISSDQHLYRVSPLEYRDFIKWFQNNGPGSRPDRSLGFQEKGHRDE